jgi:hypothetical protein
MTIPKEKRKRKYSFASAAFFYITFIQIMKEILVFKEMSPLFNYHKLYIFPLLLFGGNFE